MIYVKNKVHQHNQNFYVKKPGKIKFWKMMAKNSRYITWEDVKE